MNFFEVFYNVFLMMVLMRSITKTHQMSMNSDGESTSNVGGGSKNDVRAGRNTQARTFGFLRPLINFGLPQAVNPNFFIGNYYFPGLLRIPPFMLQSYPFRYGGQNSYTYSYGGSYPTTGGSFTLPALEYSRWPNHGLSQYGISFGSFSNSPFINGPIIATTNQNLGSSATVYSPNSNYGSNNSNLHNNKNNNNAQLLQLANLLGQVLGQQLRPYINDGSLTGSPVTYARID